MHLLDLNEDVLQHICDCLIGKDALNLSLTSRCITLRFTILPALDLVNLCPNIELVDLPLDIVEPDELASRPVASWPILRSLRRNIDSMHAACCTDHVVDLSTADHLQLRDKLSVVGVEAANRADKHMLLSPMRFWAEVAPLAPRMCYLELKLTIPSLKEEYADWLEDVPDTLSPLTLLYLRLYIPKMQTCDWVWDEQTGEDLRDTDGKLVYDATN
ncbi:hypothetical protein C8Q80DRAFT_1269131 [Daedaleopsis nitida]|nr:hypothetical protein C8Q80DRAFT_1269131 [Daedaleopsis nitida]